MQDNYKEVYLACLYVEKVFDKVWVCGLLFKLFKRVWTRVYGT